MRVGTVQAEVPEVWGTGGARFEPLPSRPEAETGDPPMLPTPDGETVVPTSPLPPSAPCSHPPPQAYCAELRRQPLGQQGSSWTSSVWRM